MQIWRNPAVLNCWVQQGVLLSLSSWLIFIIWSEDNSPERTLEQVALRVLVVIFFHYGGGFLAKRRSSHLHGLWSSIIVLINLGFDTFYVFLLVLFCLSCLVDWRVLVFFKRHFIVLVAHQMVRAVLRHSDINNACRRLRSSIVDHIQFV